MNDLSKNSAEQGATKPKNHASDSWLAIIASLAALLLFLISRKMFLEMFEEFGIDLPKLTQLCFSTVAIVVPSAILAVTMANRLFMGNSKIINIVAICVLILFMVGYFFAVLMPYMAVMSGLSA